MIDIAQKTPVLHKSPTYCHGYRCSKTSECIRYDSKRMFIGINETACTRSAHAFQIAQDTEEAAEFKRQASLHAKERVPFSLDWGRATVPTNSTMYDCYFCKAEGKEHAIEEKSTPEHLRSTDVIRRWWPSHIRVCSGCGRYDGPWVPFGDDI